MSIRVAQEPVELKQFGVQIWKERTQFNVKRWPFTSVAKSLLLSVIIVENKLTIQKRPTRWLVGEDQTPGTYLKNRRKKQKL